MPKKKSAFDRDVERINEIVEAIHDLLPEGEKLSFYAMVLMRVFYEKSQECPDTELEEVGGMMATITKRHLLPE
jgi:hypothetical protein